MKLMMVTRVYPTHRAGGMPFVCQDRVRALAKIGHDVHVVTTFCKGPQRLNDDGVEVFHDYNSPMMNWSSDFASACDHHYRSWQPDVVHLDSFDRNGMWWDNVPATVAITLHGFGWGAFLTKWNMYRASNGNTPELSFRDLVEESQALSKADVVIGVSKHEHRMLRDEYGLAHARLVYNPIAACFFDQPLESKRTGDYFLCAAVSGQKERGFDAAQEACRRAGVLFKEVRNVPREAMPGVYDGTKALLLPTFYAQGWDLAVAEARARGVPAIVSAVGSYLAEAEPFDRLVPPGDAAAVKAAIDAWQPGSRATILAAAQQHRPEWHAQKWLEAVCG